MAHRWAAATTVPWAPLVPRRDVTREAPVVHAASSISTATERESNAARPAVFPAAATAAPRTDPVTGGTELRRAFVAAGRQSAVLSSALACAMPQHTWQGTSTGCELISVARTSAAILSAATGGRSAAVANKTLSVTRPIVFDPLARFGGPVATPTLPASKRSIVTSTALSAGGCVNGLTAVKRRKLPGAAAGTAAASMNPAHSFASSSRSPASCASSSSASPSNSSSSLSALLASSPAPSSSSSSSFYGGIERAAQALAVLRGAGKSAQDRRGALATAAALVASRRQLIAIVDMGVLVTMKSWVEDAFRSPGAPAGQPISGPATLSSDVFEPLLAFLRSLPVQRHHLIQSGICKALLQILREGPGRHQKHIKGIITHWCHMCQLPISLPKATALAGPQF